MIKKTLKISIAFVGFLMLIGVVYSIIPRVKNPKVAHGVALRSVSLLSDSTQRELRQFIKDSAANMQIVMAIHHGKIIFEEGNTGKLINCHSARKSIMSLLIGIAVEKKYLSLDETLGDLGIDESKTPLTAQEKSATIKDLLMARSGVYLPAEGEVDYAKNNRPQREQYKPGEFFFYNNFDFNALGVILEQKTGLSIGTFMEKYLATPLQMQDFTAANVVYDNPWPIPNNTQSDHPVFWIYMSARDFAKIGVLLTQNGMWNGEQVVPEPWIEQSLNKYSEFTGNLAKMNAPYDAFAFSWWIEKESNTIWADGYGGQFLCIDRKNNLVVLQRNFTGNSLMSSGLFLMNKNRDNNPKSDLMHVYAVILKNLENEM